MRFVHGFGLFEVIDVNIVMMDTLVIPKVLARVFEDLVNYVVAVEISIKIQLAIATRTSSSPSFLKISNWLSFS